MRDSCQFRDSSDSADFTATLLGTFQKTPAPPAKKSPVTMRE
jgi:hypothetical protein